MSPINSNKKKEQMLQLMFETTKIDNVCFSS